ncbi:hypothetical protein BKP35_13280 [Anaerobacillus arseniciselenatis]|uniref:Uncharacterized protein n=1 Tax=Anaerobacillus arseniciselenatis TaxID=85682 RepID=A0A1S2LED6_9BACI|nr:spore germination protein GerPC [Anaerobacillus arseniciselenatis]OIJ10087.1 hypothetical protein BKP35_13280 [Anaerobacillus arseniciselenatis]
MYYQYDYSTYFQQIYQQLEAQQSKIDELEETIDILLDEISTLKNQASQQPGKIEYKFDQLKVERLEGTLNIGITPNGGVEPNSIDDFTVNRNNIDVPVVQQQHPKFYENIKKKVYDYLNNGCFDAMKSLEQHYNYQLDIPYRNFIVEDIKKQIDKRIQYYLKDVNLQDESEEALKQIEETTVNNVINDINRTMEEFIKHLPQKGE